jgi:hypothetical protein
MSKFSRPALRFLSAAAFFLIVGLACTADVRADPIPVTLVHDGAGEVVNITKDNNGLPHPITGMVFASQFQIKAGTMPIFNSYCVDLNHSIEVGQNFLANLRSTNDGLKNGGKIAYLYNTFGLGTLGNTQAAGLQLAIWKVLVDGGGAFNQGNFQALASASALQQANDYVAAAANHSSVANWLDGAPSGDQFNRGQSVLAPVTVIPEPETYVLLGIGAAGLLVPVTLRRLRRIPAMVTA